MFFPCYCCIVAIVLLTIQADGPSFVMTSWSYVKLNIFLSPFVFLSFKAVNIVLFYTVCSYIMYQHIPIYYWNRNIHTQNSMFQFSTVKVSVLLKLCVYTYTRCKKMHQSTGQGYIDLLHQFAFGKVNTVAEGYKCQITTLMLLLSEWGHPAFICSTITTDSFHFHVSRWESRIPV